MRSRSRRRRRRTRARFGEDEELWRVAALLHDFDYEIHPTLDQHPQDGAPILRELGYPEEVIEAVLSHAEHLAIPRDTPLKRTLFACDELSGFVHACGLVRPTGLDGLEPKSVRKKLKQPSFAAGVHRDDVYAGAELLGLELDEHIANVIAALQPIGPELGPAHRRRRSRATALRSTAPRQRQLDLDRVVVGEQRAVMRALLLRPDPAPRRRRPRSSTWSTWAPLIGPARLGRRALELPDRLATASRVMLKSPATITASSISARRSTKCVARLQLGVGEAQVAPRARRVQRRDEEAAAVRAARTGRAGRRGARAPSRASASA